MENAVVQRVIAGTVLSLLVGVSSLAAQGLLRGMVVTEGGRPVPTAEVRWLPSGGTTVTDIDGRFRLARPARATGLQIRRPGFHVRLVALDSLRGDSLRIVVAEAPTELAGLTVLGEGAGALARLPGSGAVIETEVLAAMRPLSANEALRMVPGVNVQDEEGMGLRANIGVRGLDPDRSRTLLVLEDGVPVALNPYGEPEMYYSPPIDRMARLEILKGSGSILHGPQTIGGVLNYVTPDPSATPELRWAAGGGSGGFARGQVRASGTWGSTGVLGVATYRRADDLRGLDFSQVDVMLKGTVRLGARDALGIKVGAYDETSNSTYVGLTDSLFRADPLAYPGRDDLLAVRRLTASLSHQRQLGSGTSLRTVGYAFTTVRDWSRQNYGYNATRNSLQFSNGTGNRNRAFEVAGLESRLRALTAIGEFEGGVRAHVEGARDQFYSGTTATSRSGALRDDETRSGAAVAAFAQQHIDLTSRLRVTPGVRLEHMTFARNILRMRVRRTAPGGTTFLPEDVDIRSRDAVSVVIPGIGASWFASPSLTVFAGAHRGFAPPRTKDAFVVTDETLAAGQSPSDPVVLQLDAEDSWNVELGLRAQPIPGVHVEATGFLLDFTNQIITPSLSGGSVSQAALANQGATRHRGVEVAVEVDWEVQSGLPFRTGGQVTLVDAVFSRDRLLQQGAEVVNVRGNRLPYAPTVTAAFHATWGRLGSRQLRVDGTYIGAQFADNFETLEGSADGRIGRIPSQTLWHLSGSLPIAGTRTALVASVKNLLDRSYIASRRPEGIKPGLPRTVQVGIEMAM